MLPSRTFAPRATQGNIITTTVFAGGDPTATSSSSSGSAPLPIGAIVGGLLGGVFLALAAVGGWIWWGKLIERQRRKQPRLRSALKKEGRSTPSVNASKHSLPRSHPMASVLPKSVSFAPVPSSSSSEDSDFPLAPSPGSSSDVSNNGAKGKQTPRTALHEAGTSTTTSPSPGVGITHPRTPPLPRGALRSPTSLRGQTTDRAYAPARPSPLSHATRPPSVAEDPPSQGLQPPLLTGSMVRSSDVSAPPEYSQEGVASEVEPMLRRPDARFFAHHKNDGPYDDSEARAHTSQHAGTTTTRLQ